MSSSLRSAFFFFNDTATTEIYTLSLHDALPILHQHVGRVPDEHLTVVDGVAVTRITRTVVDVARSVPFESAVVVRSEEHTSELQSRQYLVCRLLLEKKKK